MSQTSAYFRRLTNSGLAHTITDILAAQKVAETWVDHGVGANKYADQLHTAVAERNRRTEHNTCKSCKRPL